MYRQIFVKMSTRASRTRALKAIHISLFTLQTFQSLHQSLPSSFVPSHPASLTLPYHTPDRTACLEPPSSSRPAPLPPLPLPPHLSPSASPSSPPPFILDANPSLFALAPSPSYPFIKLTVSSTTSSNRPSLESYAPSAVVIMRHARSRAA